MPLVYACSGCSNVAQLCNRIALELDRAGQARMSCISGVGGEVPSLVKLARSGLPILALDGCELACVQACLAKVHVTPAVHLVLTAQGLRKRQGCDADNDAAQAARDWVATALTQLSQVSPPGTVSLASPVCYQNLPE